LFWVLIDFLRVMNYVCRVGQDGASVERARACFPSQ